MIFARTAKEIVACFDPVQIHLHHIGSTAVPGLLAKPIIDMLLVAPALPDLDRRATDLAALGFAAKGENGIAGRRYFVRRDACGMRTHHLHAFADGAQAIARHLAFRDCLRADANLLDEYASIKRRALGDGSVSRAQYQDRKDAFIARVLASRRQKAQRSR